MKTFYDADNTLQSAEETRLHAFVLAFMPRDEWHELGEEAFFNRTDPYYIHDYLWPPEYGPANTPHSFVGRVHCIFRDGVFRGFLRGEPPSVPPRGSMLEGRTDVWTSLPAGTPCFAIITADGMWHECFEAESSVLLLEKDDQLIPVNPPQRLSRMQIKWRAFVAEYVRNATDQVFIGCDALLWKEWGIQLWKMGTVATVNDGPAAIEL